MHALVAVHNLGHVHIAGVVGLIISLVWMFGRRRRAVTTTSVAAPRTEVYEERRYTEPPL